MTIKKPAVVTCPQCNAEVIWDSKISPFRPFCSERCKLIDLGQWAAESYRVPTSDDPARIVDEDNYQA